MKILYTVDNAMADHNAYVRVFIKHLKQLCPNVVVDYGISTFWNDDCFQYDIVHIMWPHFLLLLGSRTEHSCEELDERLEQLQNHGVKIVSTCHNIKPHYNENPDAICSYNIVYCRSKFIFHLGNYSRALFEKEYPHANNIILEHPVYDIEYPFLPSRKESKRILKLKENVCYILCFGAFRSDDERKLIMNLSRHLPYNQRILAPVFCRIKWRRNILKVIKQILQFCFYKVFCHKIIFTGKMISQKALPYYFRACEVTVIQRCQTLNSGNLPLSFYFGNVTVGPDTGNIGEILKENNNPVFDPCNSLSLQNAVHKATKLLNTKIPRNNRKIAKSHWNSLLIAKKLLYYYEILMSQDIENQYTAKNNSRE